MILALAGGSAALVFARALAAGIADIVQQLWGYGLNFSTLLGRDAGVALLAGMAALKLLEARTGA